MEAGTFYVIVGGGHNASFTGDSHIVINQSAGGTVDYIVGGNHEDSGAPSFTGDSYISVFTNTVQGSIIGGSTSAHSSSPTFNGSTNIFIYAPLTSNPDAFDIHNQSALGAGYLIGSSAWVRNVAGTNAVITHNGDSNIKIDLSDYNGGAADFTKRIIGASYLSNGKVFSMIGNANLKIVGHSDVSFTNPIFGGSYIVNGTSTINGEINMSLSGDSTYNTVVVGSNYMNSDGTRHSTVTKDVTLTIEGGTFNQEVMAGNYYVNTTGTNSGTTTFGGDMLLNITGGTFNAAVTGGSSGSTGIVEDTVYTHSGKQIVTISGGSFTQSVSGGSRIGGPINGAVSTGGVEMQISGGVFDGDIIGGYNRSSGTSAVTATLTMGAVDISLTGGTVNGDVYAAGFISQAQDAGTTFTTESVRVAIGSEMEFGTGVTISALFGGDGATSGTVTGSKTLAFSSAANYDNLAELSFMGFDTVDVAEGGSVNLALAAAELTKTGLGTLELAAADRTLLTVEAGTLKLASAANTITAIDVKAGGTLDLSNGTVSQIDSLTLAGLSGLTLSNTGTAQALGSLSLSGVDASNKVVLDVGTLGSNFSVALFSGLTEAELSDITFITTGSFLNANALDYFDIQGLSAGQTAFLVLGADGTLSLVNSLVSDLTWGGGSGSISDRNWAIDGAADQPFTNELRYTFNIAESAAITIDTAMEAMSFSVSGEGVNYTFTQADGTASLVTSVLSVTGGASASFEMDNLDLTDSTVTIGDASTLSLKQNQTIKTLSSTGTLDATGYAITDATAAGGSITAGSLNLAAGANSFTLLNVTGDVTSTEGTLSVGGTSSVGGLVGIDNLIVTGADSSLNVRSDVTLESFSNEGSAQILSILSVTNEITAGGRLIVDELNLGDDAYFDELNAGQVTFTQASKLSLGGSSNLDGLTNAHTLELRAGAEVDIEGTLSLSTLSNAGELSVQGNLTVANAVTSGGILAVGTLAGEGEVGTLADLTLSGNAEAQNTFTQLKVSGNVLGQNGTLTLGEGSIIGGNLSGGALVTTGDVSIGSNTAGVRSLNNGTGTLSMGNALHVGTDGFTNNGSIDVQGSVRIDSVSTQGGKLSATGAVSLTGESNTFTSIDTTGVIQGTDTLIVSEFSSALNLYKSAASAGVDQVNMALQITDAAAEMVLATNNMVSLKSVNGAGSLSMAKSTSLALSSTSSMNNLTLGTGTDANISSLILGGSLTLSGELNTTENLHLRVDFSPMGGNAALTVANTTANSLNSILVEMTA